MLKFIGYKNYLLNNETTLKSQQNLKVEHIMYIQKKSTKLREAVMMIRDCKLLIELHHITKVQVLGKYVKQSC